MTQLLLDTHVLVWLFEGIPRMGKKALELTAESFSANGLKVSAISFWEVAMLVRRRKLSGAVDAAAWRRMALSIGLVEIPVTGDIGVNAADLADFHPDPADRIVVATALHEKAILLTADRKILAWPGPVVTHDAES
ncbi:type II toxin-antitoxin system VapC family toxin [Skermanella mucosa]|uniref:type II toxin-antitoxin system VapC family toxin n=1 Tax=Skermanella mucosa TaxID=1789672 RepID=UPI00192CE039|nr:type II toxin-antitoxin system VapC family toxin [Skermanella mucosa]UEM21210.1 type II toxin-antitoxin system VapC family toxin [Skermanella mucosa]